MGDVPPKSSLSRRIPGFPATPPESLLTVRIDTREKTPFDFSTCRENVTTTIDTIKAGDYCLHIDPSIAIVERKSLPDFAAMVSQRDRFLGLQIPKLIGSTDRPLLVIEADYTQLEDGMGWRGRVTPNQVIALLHTVSAKVPVILARDPHQAARACWRHLRLALTSRYKRAREFARHNLPS